MKYDCVSPILEKVYVLSEQSLKYQIEFKGLKKVHEEDAIGVFFLFCSKIYNWETQVIECIKKSTQKGLHCY